MMLNKQTFFVRLFKKMSVWEYYVLIFEFFENISSRSEEPQYRIRTTRRKNRRYKKRRKIKRSQKIRLFWNSFAQTISNAKKIIITAGAGMGVDSGSPDFRGDQGFGKPILH